MTMKIGFTADHSESDSTFSADQNVLTEKNSKSAEPRKSLVTIVTGSGKTLTCYNDQYCIRTGDIVFAEREGEPVRGYVTEVSYNFKIKKSAYKKIVFLADTEVRGQFYNAESHFVTFDEKALPVQKIKTWYLPPRAEGEEFEVSTDGESFGLENLSSMNIKPHIAQRGAEYYSQNKVLYISLDKSSGKGYAIVSGNDFYEVDFEYADGSISGNLCSCPCSFTCKHQFAAMLQLKETLEVVEKHYSELFDKSGYFAAMVKGELFKMAVDKPETGGFTL